MINLYKGEAVSLAKVPEITVVVSWPAKTDYDLGAEILYKDGSTESIATFGAGALPVRASKNGTVVHNGDAGRGSGDASESLTIQWDPQIHTIAPWAYSAQSNGSGSFRKYKVSMTVTAGDQVAHLSAADASRVSSIYTCVPGFITFSDDGVTVRQEERYSDRGSERRPFFSPSGQLHMNGNINNYK